MALTVRPSWALCSQSLVGIRICLKTWRRSPFIIKAHEPDLIAHIGLEFVVWVGPIEDGQNGIS